jgi:hypothetical protein
MVFKIFIILYLVKLFIYFFQKKIFHIDSLLGLWLNYDDNEFVDFLTLLELSLKTFKYRGKLQIQTLK